MERHERYGKARRIPVNFLDGKSKDRGWPALDSGGDGAAAPVPETASERGEAHESAGTPLETVANEMPESAVQSPQAAATVAEPVEMAELRARAADLEDRWKRAAADLDNYRKRFDRELDRLRGADRETIFRAWLTIMDDIERALCSQGASSNPWYEGMEAIHERMLAVLAQFGVRPFVPQGETFDPARHEAVATANLPDEAEGRIVEVVQPGYLLDGKLLRPARVIAVKRAE